jgi:membrane-bound metal-dependent hydrolase YbcI (DUF457 family)
LTTIGHTLAGLTVGYLTIPSGMTTRQKGVLLAAFAFVANIPDLPLTRYIITHSIFIVAAAVMLFVILAKLFLRRSPYFTNRFLVGWSLALYCHLLLDSLYNRVGEQGYEMFWPLSSTVRFGLPIPWLRQADKIHVLSLHNVRVAFFEILTFGTILLLAILAKKFMSQRNTTVDKSQAIP